MLLALTGAGRLVVLGDLLHSGIGLTPELVESVAAWRQSPQVECVEIMVVPGNHDGNLRQVVDAWGLAISDPVMTEGPFAFRHEPIAVSGRYTLTGHVHPQVRLRGSGDSLRLPCFWMGAEVGVLPAFSAFTRGSTVSPVARDAVYAIAEGQIRRV